MIGIVLTGHGHFASGIASSLELIAGKQPNLVVVDFPQSDSVEQLEEKLNRAYNELSGCEGILVLSDLAGGSPFKSAVICGVDRSNINVIAGANLPMLLEVAMTRQFETVLETLTNQALESGKMNIVRFEGIKETDEQEDDLFDGI